MVKQIVFFILLFPVLRLDLLAQEPYRLISFDTETANLKGSIKSIHEYAYLATDTNGYVEIGEMGYNVNADFPIVVHFDKKGRVTHEKISYGDTTNYTQYDYIYDDKGKITTFYITLPESGKRMTGYLIYDKKSRMTSRGSGKDPNKHFSRFYYSKNPECIRVDHLDTAFNVKLRYEYDYENGKKVAFRHYKNGFFYSKNRGDIRSDVKNTDSMVLLYKLDFEYDEKGNLRYEIRTTVEWNFPPDTTFFTYDSNNRMIHSERHDKSNMAYWMYDYQYDKYGNVTKFEFTNRIEEGSDITSHNYTYDEIGNWTEQETFENGILTRIIKRKIEYY